MKAGYPPPVKVIAHVDLDAFYAQVEMQRDPQRLSRRPVAVVQYNPYGDLKSLSPEDDRLMNSSNGSLIAVNYAARAEGVKRNLRGDEARKLCPDLQLVQVPTKHGKADLTIYRDAGRKVLEILGRADVRVERASIDECYLDLTAAASRRVEQSGDGTLTPPTRVDQIHVYGLTGECSDVYLWWTRPFQQWSSGERLLAAGASIVAELRARVEVELGYTCSAGIAHTRLLSKLCSGLHKPAQQTVLPASGIEWLLRPLPLSKLRGLGGQFGQRVGRDLGVTTVGDILDVSITKLQTVFGEKDGLWLYNLVRGNDDAEVEERKLPKSVSCGKTFRGANTITDLESVHSWLRELAGELEERLNADKDDNKRVPQLLTVSIGSGGSNGRGLSAGGVSRSCSLGKGTLEAMALDALGLVRRWAAEQPQGWKITDLFLCASNFVSIQSTSITQFLKQPAPVPAENGAPCSSGLELNTTTDVGDDGGKQPTESKGSKPTSSRDFLHGLPKSTLGTVDPTVLEALPPDIRKEVINQMKFEAMNAHSRSRQQTSQLVKAEPSANRKRGRIDADGSSQQTLMQCLKGKRIDPS